MPTNIHLIPNTTLIYEDGQPSSSGLFVQFNDLGVGYNYSYVISGIPSGWDYSINGSTTAPQIPAGVTVDFDPANGTLTFTDIPPNFGLYNFSINPPENSDEDATNITITGTITDCNGNIVEELSENSISTIIMTDAVADDVDLSIDDITDATGPVQLDLLASLQDTDGSETIAGYTIAGIPNGFSFQDANGDPVGTDNGNGTWDFDPNLIGAITLVPTSGYSGDVTLSHSVTNEEGAVITYTFDGTNLEFDDSNNSNTSSIVQLINFTDSVVCFAAHTCISTPNGEQKISDISVGDMVETVDHGQRPVQWIESKHVPLANIQANEKLRPVVIEAGALGDNLPTKDLMVSQNHRILLSSWKTEVLFNLDMALTAAKNLVGMKGVRLATDEELKPTEGITYRHMMFADDNKHARHEIVISEGTKSESFHPGDWTLNNVFSHAAREEILELFPHLKNQDVNPIPHAKPSISPHEAQLLHS